MRLSSIVIKLALFAVPATFASAVSADGREACQQSAASASLDSINCSGRWVAADGTLLGAVPDPRDTPKTPYRGSGRSAKVWSSDGAYTQNLHQAEQSRIWRSVSPEQSVPLHQQGSVRVIRGAQQHTVHPGSSSYYSGELLGAEHHRSGSQIITSTARHLPDYCNHVGQQQFYSSSAFGSGCFSYDEHGQAQTVPCPANISSGHEFSQQSHVEVWANVQQHHAGGQIQHGYQDNHVIKNDAFFATLNGGVGSDGGVFYGGGGYGYGYGASTSVLGQAPLLRFGGQRKGGGEKRHGGGKKGGHGGGKKGGHGGGKMGGYGGGGH